MTEIIVENDRPDPHTVARFSDIDHTVKTLLDHIYSNAPSEVIIIDLGNSRWLVKDGLVYDTTSDNVLDPVAWSEEGIYSQIRWQGRTLEQVIEWIDTLPLAITDYQFEKLQQRKEELAGKVDRIMAEQKALTVKLAKLSTEQTRLSIIAKRARYE